MSIRLYDATGKSYGLQIDSKNRLHNSSVARTEADAAIAAGRYFIANSGIITITSASVTPILYIKNNSDFLLYFDSYLISAGASTSGSGQSYTKTYAVSASTTSSIITNASSATQSNANFSSPETFDGLLYKGANGDTITNGVIFNQIIHPSGQFTFETKLLSVFGKGAQGILAYQPPTGNTSQEVIITATMYFVDSELTK